MFDHACSTVRVLGAALAAPKIIKIVINLISILLFFCFLYFLLMINKIKRNKVFLYVPKKIQSKKSRDYLYMRFKPNKNAN